MYIPLYCLQKIASKNNARAKAPYLLSLNIPRMIFPAFFDSNLMPFCLSYFWAFMFVVQQRRVCVLLSLSIFSTPLPHTPQQTFNAFQYYIHVLYFFLLNYIIANTGSESLCMEYKEFVSCISMAVIFFHGKWQALKSKHMYWRSFFCCAIN